MESSKLIEEKKSNEASLITRTLTIISTSVRGTLNSGRNHKKRLIFIPVFILLIYLLHLNVVFEISAPSEEVVLGVGEPANVIDNVGEPLIVSDNVGEASVGNVGVLSGKEVVQDIIASSGEVIQNDHAPSLLDLVTPSEEVVEENEDLSEEVLLNEKKVPLPLLPTRNHKEGHELIYKNDEAVDLSDSWTPAMTEERRRIFKERSELAKEQCTKVKHNTPGFFGPRKSKVIDNLRWVRDHDMVWCPIFKSASTTWVKNLLLLKGETYLDMSLHGRVRELYPKPDDPLEMKHVLAKSMRMIIVRHPLDRLLSAYRDKMLRVQGACDNYLRIQKTIMERYKDRSGLPQPTSIVTLSLGPDKTKCILQHFENKRKNITPKLLKNKREANFTFVHPTFSQFLQKVRDDLKQYWKKNGQSQVNLHWRPYWMTCGPCSVVNYDVIAKIESLGPDQEYIIRELGLQNILFNTHTHASNFDSFNQTSDAARHYFSQVPESLLRRIIQYYQPDFDIFGYYAEPYLALTKGFR